MGRLTTFLAAALAISATASIAGAYVLDWNATGVNYPAGGIGSSTDPNNIKFSNVDGSGVDMHFYWAGDTGTFLSNYSYDPNDPNKRVTLPDDDAAKDAFNMSALWYGVDANATGYVSLVIEFSKQVSNVSFDLYDVDGAMSSLPSDPNVYKEYTRIKGFKSGVAVAMSDYDGGDDVRIYDPTDPVVGVIFLNGGKYDTTPPDPNNWGWVSFDGPIDKIGLQFKWTEINRGQLIGNIEFVPEPASVGLLALGGMAVLRRRRR